MVFEIRMRTDSKAVWHWPGYITVRAPLVKSASLNWDGRIGKVILVIGVGMFSFQSTEVEFVFLLRSSDV